jgi:hypothetical protein
MTLSEFGLKEEEIRCITPEVIGASPPAMILMKMLKHALLSEQGHLMDGVVGCSDETPSGDFRFSLGQCHLARKMLEAPEEAKKWCSE